MHLDDTAPEEWRPVPGYEGWYSVSSLGRVRRDAATSGARVGRPLAPKTNHGGYYYVTLSCRQQWKHHQIHRLVAAAFIGPCPTGRQVNHRNAVKTDNRALNLEYVTGDENMAHAVRHGLLLSGDRHPARLRPETMARGSTNGNSRLTAEAVAEIRSLHAAGLSTVAELAARYNVVYQTVAYVVQRKTWRHMP